jgi:hypothetical protein
VSLAGVAGIVMKTTHPANHCVISADSWKNLIRLVLDSDDLKHVQEHRRFSINEMLCTIYRCPAVGCWVVGDCRRPSSSLWLLMAILMTTPKGSVYEGG